MLRDPKHSTAYNRQAGYVLIDVSLFICLLAGLRKNYSTDFHKIRWKGGTWSTKETIGGNPDQVTVGLR